MLQLRRAAILQAALIGVLIVQVIVYYPRLPDPVASHFGASGAADGWMNKPAFAAFSIVFPIILAGVMLGTQLMMTFLGRVPASMINLPNKQYWLAPERQAETMAWLAGRMSRYMLWLGTATTALIVILMGMTLRSNLTPEPRLDYVWPVMIVYLGFILGDSFRMTIEMYRRFGRAAVSVSQAS